MYKISSSNYSILNSSIDILSDPLRTDHFTVLFTPKDETDTLKNPFWTTPELLAIQKADLPKQEDVIVQRWYFGTCKSSVIGANRHGEITIEAQLRREYLEYFADLVGLIWESGTEDSNQSSRPELSPKFSKMELEVGCSTGTSAMVFTLYNCLVTQVNFSALSYSSSDIFTVTFAVHYDNFDVRAY